MTDLLHAPVDKARECLSSVILLPAPKRIDNRLRDLSPTMARAGPRGTAGEQRPQARSWRHRTTFACH